MRKRKEKRKEKKNIKPSVTELLKKPDSYGGV